MRRANEALNRRTLERDYPGLLGQCNGDIDLAERVAARKRRVITAYNLEIADAIVEREIEKLDGWVARLMADCALALWRCWLLLGMCVALAIGLAILAVIVAILAVR